jgi:ABC-type Fe3+/spermidine/putrescine transport system ATPase subunit
MSDRVAVMQGGRIEQVGSPDELYDRPVSRFVADFLGDSNFLDAIAVSAEGDGRWRCRAAGGLEFSGVGAVPLEAGQSITAGVRPEKLVQAEDAAALGPGANTCKGLVEEAIYVGDATRYRVGLGSDGAVTIKVPNRVSARPLATGAAVALAWSPDDTRLFPCADA